MEVTQKNSDPQNTLILATERMERKDGERSIKKGACFEGKGYAINRSVLLSQRLLVNVEKKNNKNQIVCSDIQRWGSLIKSIL